ncbi:MAG: IclR family transcriptional regulator, partial [Actinophytocola sp.]|nr:IclR family transcriptional regulator [Actinophytocola sp.]
ATGVGKALLAFTDAQFLRHYLSRALERPTAYTIVEPGRLRRELTAVRCRGYAVTREEMTLGSCSVAAPILDGERKPLAAVGVVVHTARVDPERLATPVEESARAIAARLAEAADDPYPTLQHDFAVTPQGRLVRMPRRHTAG